MRPNAKGKAALPHLDISGLRPGHLEIYEHRIGPGYMGFKTGIIFLQLSDGSVKAWDVPVKNGHVAMPEFHWWRPTYVCEQFGPDNPNGLVTTSTVLSCKDPDISDWWKSHWRWAASGKSIQGMVDDLEPAKGTVEGEYFVVGKRR